MKYCVGITMATDWGEEGDPKQVDRRLVRRVGSPTVRVDGSDVDPRARERTDYGLKCRIYRSEEGRSPLPPAEWIRGALGRTHG